VDCEEGRGAPYEGALALVAWADTAGEGWVSGCAVEQGVDLDGLTTHKLFSWLYVTMCRDAAGGVAWHDVREANDKALGDIAESVLRQWGRTPARLDPETWGASPEQQAEMLAAMRMAGG